MENNIFSTSIGIGGIIFAGLILFWFVSVYLKKRMTLDQSNQRLSTLNKINWEEKREHPRMEISWQASIESSRGTDQVQLKDISLGGAFVFCRQPLSLKEKFKITLRLPNSGPLSLNGEVVWSNANVPEDEVINRGMGVRFIENTEQDQKQLKDAISAAFEKSDIPNGALMLNGQLPVITTAQVFNFLILKATNLLLVNQVAFVYGILECWARSEALALLRNIGQKIGKKPFFIGLIPLSKPIIFTP